MKEINWKKTNNGYKIIYDGWESDIPSSDIQQEGISYETIDGEVVRAARSRLVHEKELLETLAIAGELND